jgi:hypothetical protein
MTQRIQTLIDQYFATGDINDLEEIRKEANDSTNLHTRNRARDVYYRVAGADYRLPLLLNNDNRLPFWLRAADDDLASDVMPVMLSQE